MLDVQRLRLEEPRPLRRAEYDRLVLAGVFEHERLELLEGVIVHMNPQGAPHAATIGRLTKLFVRLVGERAEVRVQSPFAASDASEPEPDLAIVPPGDYDQDHPRAAHLIIEVAVSSLDLDRQIKAEIYAKCGVPEYWVVNLAERVIEVHTRPEGDRYTALRVYVRGESIALTDLAATEVAVDSVVR